MARTKDEILEALLTAKDNNDVLNAIITSNSKSAFYYSLFVLISEFTGDFENTFDDFLEQAEEILESKQVQQDAWWIRESLAFQLGDTLVTQSNGNLGYSEEDEDLQIIKRAAIVSTSQGAITLKVAKLDTDDETPIPLESAELSAFSSYVNDITPAGIVPTVISVDGDEVQVGLSVVINPQIINETDGTLLSDGETKPVEEAIYDYYGVFQDDSFGGTFYGNALMSTILAASGVINATFTVLNKKASNEGSYTDVLSLTGRSFGTFSGYVKNATGWVLSDNITYESVE